VGAHTSQIFSFVNKIFGGDFILMLSGKGKKISVGYVLGQPIDKELLIA
jgi:predicted Mrr-cat superfamily restriction endonuclease